MRNDFEGYKNCPYCNKIIQENSSTCPHCNAKINTTNSFDIKYLFDNLLNFWRDCNFGKKCIVVTFIIIISLMLDNILFNITTEYTITCEEINSYGEPIQNLIVEPKVITYKNAKFTLLANYTLS